MNSLIEIMQNIASKEANTSVIMELGVVKAVFPHSEENDKHNYQCTVELKNRKSRDGKPLELKMVPILVPYIGMTCIPNVNDLVAISFIGGNINSPIITGRLYNSEDRAPLNKEKEIQIKHSNKNGGTIKIDAEGAITITSKNDKNILTLNDDKLSICNDKMKVVIDFSSEKLSLTSSKDIEITAEGALKLEGQKVEIKSKSTVKIEAGSSLDIKSSAGMTLKGSTIDLN